MTIPLQYELDVAIDDLRTVVSKQYAADMASKKAIESELSIARIQERNAKEAASELRTQLDAAQLQVADLTERLTQQEGISSAAVERHHILEKEYHQLKKKLEDMTAHRDDLIRANYNQAELIRELRNPKATTPDDLEKIGQVISSVKTAWEKHFGPF